MCVGSRLICHRRVPRVRAKSRASTCQDLWAEPCRLIALRGEHTPTPPLWPSLTARRPGASGPQSLDTRRLAGTSVQRQGEPSQISLCYFRPTKDAGPLPQSHKYLRSCPLLGSGCFLLPETHRLEAEGLARKGGLIGVHNSRAGGVLRSQTGKLSLKTHLSQWTTCPLAYASRVALGIFYPGEQRVGLGTKTFLKLGTKSPLRRHIHFLAKNGTSFYHFSKIPPYSGHQQAEGKSSASFPLQTPTQSAWPIPWALRHAEPKARRFPSVLWRVGNTTV